MNASFDRSAKHSAKQSARRSPLSKVGLSLLLALPLGRRRPLNGSDLNGSDPRSQHSERGLSLIECLVAIIVISITVVAITPPIMLATASRIQSRKAERANQIAQGEIDRVKLLVERGTYVTTDLPADAGTNTISAVNAASNVSSLLYVLSKQATPVCSNTYPPTTPMPAASVALVDIDGDCQADYVMQVFRTTGYTPTGAAAPFSFVMGVRVYAYYPNLAFIPLDKTKASLRMGTGPLDLVGGKRRPMAVLYSAMSRNDSSKSLGQLCQQQNAGTSCNF